MSDIREAGRLQRWLRRLLAIPGNIVGYAYGKWSGLLQSARLDKNGAALSVPPKTAQALSRSASRRPGGIGNGTAVNRQPTAAESDLVRAIREETERLNRNNVTRTHAYWSVFERTPELHWAFLAHMVSRNGGWNMTDLKGELLARLLSPSRADHIFAFLERVNALIFQDAYPQLRLYEASLRRKRPLFHLLPSFGVSAFMRPVWETFWRERSSPLLTVALIVNEQSYIEGRVVQNEHFRRTVLDTPAFQAQSLLQLNVIVFPFRDREAGGDGGEYRLAGLVLEQFDDVRERIEFGKKLYAILFGVPAVSEGARLFASSQPHTGSRADYWPSLFAPIRHSAPQKHFQERLDGCKLLPGAEKLYSPQLGAAWNDVPLQPPERYDWYREESAYDYIVTPKPPASFMITNEYCFALNKLELAVMAGELLFD